MIRQPQQFGCKKCHLLQNTCEFPEENRGFATRMGPPGGVFVAKLQVLKLQGVTKSAADE
jgi:hypothetical protein